MKRLTILLSVLVLTLSACADRTAQNALDLGPTPSGALPAGSAKALPAANQFDDRKLIRSGALSIETEAFDETVSEVGDVAEQYGGFLSNSEVARPTGGERRASITIRVPAPEFDSALASLRLLGAIQAETTEVEDISKAYFDLETRLRVSRDTESRLRRILKDRTADVAEILNVERELGRIVESIEELEGTRRFYDGRLALSTLVVTVVEARSILEAGTWSPVTNAFGASTEVLIRSIAALVYIVVFFAPWLLFAAAGWVLVRYVRNYEQRKRTQEVSQ